MSAEIPDDALLGRLEQQRISNAVEVIAEQIQKDFVGFARAGGPHRRLEFDSLMLTAHQRVAHPAARRKNGDATAG